MAPGKLPRGREKRITEGSGSVKRRGDGLGMGGPVGNSGGYDDRVSRLDSAGTGGGSMKRGGRGGIIGIAVALIAALLGGGSLLGTGGSQAPAPAPVSGVSQSSDQSSSMGSLLSSGGFAGYGFSGTQSGWVRQSNNGLLNTSSPSGVPAKRTQIKGNGQDSVTVMVYMCGTDLESRGGMATSDLQEMTSAKLSDKVNVIVYTGGCKAWKNQVISNSRNQIYQIKNGGLKLLEADMGSGAMTDSQNLETFIKYCTKNFPGNRYDLIFWDHGGGSVSGYGYDEKYAGSGSMSLAAINTALKNSGTVFDFIGFDACLMATMENALMLSSYGDYMIASEESEPGFGWYYTDWLTKLSENTSMDTVQIGKNIADDFVRVCTEKGQGSITTLSVTDLGEISVYGPEAMKAFAEDASALIKDKQYQAVASARTESKEFARSSGIDQVDLTHLALNMDTEGGKKLADTICSAVKYNRVANNISNAYGLSVYFPYKKASYVDSAVRTYDAIGMDDEYARCIQEFASMEAVGQAYSGGTSSPYGSLSGGSSYSGQGMDSTEMLMNVLSSLMGGGSSIINGLSSANTSFLSGRSLEDYADYVSENNISPEELSWIDGENGKILGMKKESWNLITNLELNVFYDDGEGYVDLGMDNIYSFTDNGELIGEYDNTWLAINGQPVAYYFVDEEDDGESYTITGRVPAFLNGERVDLMLVFNNENPYGYIEGARYFYENGETDTIAKSLEPLKAGDKLDFVCDFYNYDGTFENNYYLGDTLTLGDEIEISNVSVGDGEVKASYRLTDIYNQHYWTETM